jgi:hypothetical protein
VRKWGIIISVVYALILQGLLFPLGVLLAGEHGLLSPQFYADVLAGYGEWIVWVPVGVLIAGQVALLALSVDASQKRLKPRAPVKRSAAVAATLFTLLSVSAIASIGVAMRSDNFLDKIAANLLLALAGLWVAWAVVFYLYLRGKTEITNRVVSWLLRGSVLELLIAIPCHVIVRRRNDCSAPIATGFGIAAGIAIMLLSFGPSVLLLYKKRMDALRSGQGRQAAAH